MVVLCFGFSALPALAKDIQIRCEMTNVSQPQRTVASLKQHPWAVDLFLNENQNSARVQGPLTRTFSSSPVVANVTYQDGGRVKLHWSIPGLRAETRQMSGYYIFRAVVNVAQNSISLRVIDDKHNSRGPAFVTGLCRKI